MLRRPQGLFVFTVKDIRFKDISLMKKALVMSITLSLIAGVSACEKDTMDITPSTSANAKAGVAVSNVVTETRIVPYPYTYGWIWNKSTTAATTVTCYYNMTLSSSTGWAKETTKVLSARQDFTYCKMGVKQIKLVIQYDKSQGSYEFLSGKTYSCR